MGMDIDTFVPFTPDSYGHEVIGVSTRKRLDFNTNLLTSFVHYQYWDENSNALSYELISLSIMYDGVDRSEKPYTMKMFKIKANNSN